MKVIGRSQRVRLLAYLALGVVALVILAAGVSGLEMQTGQVLFKEVERPLVAQEDEEQQSASFIDVSNAGTVIVLISIGTIALYAAVRWRQVRYTLLVLSLFAASVVAMVYLYTRFVEPSSPEEEETVPLAVLEEQRIPAELLENPPDWLDPISIAVTVAVLGAAAVVVRYLWRRRARQTRGTLDMIAAEAEAALAEIRAGVDLRDAVMRCYVEMNQGLRKSLGLVRAQAMTPREFERALTDTGLPQASVQRLTRLFEAVRYGRQAASERDKLEAVDCLEDIIAAAHLREEQIARQQLRVKVAPNA